ncbi:MAG: FAD-binding oxidoreductase [Desulfobacula sp.]|jgi:sarcosine oxidase, subunit beta|uniref:NAD(P)/FAD-dependent oxidoreductase n=2 Tax=Desulfobacula sp. TaxID=2593537 RepID=UPI001DC67E8E|nr:FAD-binding oxidoreductase [Desulfobacula sp.]MBT3483725.1 FAD-binding oxidoreductase [Desulfobacula sp.]MBT3803499.1 FAD-binding oxidoreductase [Desulfobacula sp.]MBT4023294.1 FAD-binding oxidoreductase [Desulfobacula sp.]MBT4197280.1 FAD-binding oxidoreductase [Desulfobacula sp.]
MSRIMVPQNFTSKTADAVVIGGGIVGTATAFWLSRTGMKVILVEKRNGLSSLTTAASAECFRTQFTEKSMAEIALPSVEMFENFKDVVELLDIDIHLRQKGYLFVTDDENQVPDLEKAIQTYQTLGIPGSELMKGSDLHDRFPFLAPNVLAGTFNNRDGWLSTHETTYGFAKGAKKVDFFMKTKVTGIQKDNQGISSIETDRGIISTRLVVNCAGPYAGIIGKMAGLDMPLTTVRRQKAYVRTSSPLVPVDAPFTVDLKNHSYWRPEAGGVLCAWVDPDEPESPPADELPTDWDFAAESIYRASRLNPFFETISDDLKAEDIDVSAGMYVYTPDDKPVIGPCDEIKGLHLNCGYWCGVMMSPAAGKRVADIATGIMDNKDNLLRYSRFKEGDFEKGDTFLK